MTTQVVELADPSLDRTALRDARALELRAGAVDPDAPAARRARAAEPGSMGAARRVRTRALRRARS